MSCVFTGLVAFGPSTRKCSLCMNEIVQLGVSGSFGRSFMSCVFNGLLAFRPSIFKCSYN